jgi:hypothetical protein
LLQKSAMTRALWLARISIEWAPAIGCLGMGWSETQRCRTPHRLRKARFRYRRRSYDQLGEPAAHAPAFKPTEGEAKKLSLFNRFFAFVYAKKHTGGGDGEKGSNLCPGVHRQANH